MLQEQEIRIETTRILVALDKENKLVHMLDLNGRKTLTNALTPDFCRRVLNILDLYKGVKTENYRFICYHTDAVISEYTLDNRFLYPNPEDVYEQFKKDMYYMYGI